jgi:hypothetical protein
MFHAWNQLSREQRMRWKLVAGVIAAGAAFKVRGECENTASDGVQELAFFRCSGEPPFFLVFSLWDARPPCSTDNNVAVKLTFVGLSSGQEMELPNKETRSRSPPARKKIGADRREKETLD